MYPIAPQPHKHGNNKSGHQIHIQQVIGSDIMIFGKTDHRPTPSVKTTRVLNSFRIFLVFCYINSNF